jgi:hypothetical protein
MKYQFRKLPDEAEHDHSEIVYTNSGVLLETVLEDFENFLKAMGFNIDGGHLQVVYDEPTHEEPDEITLIRKDEEEE